MNILNHVLVNICAKFSLGSVPGIGVALWQSVGVINSTRYCQIIFQDRCILLSSSWQYTSIPTDSHSHQCFLESTFLSTDNLVNCGFHLHFHDH